MAKPSSASLVNINTKFSERVAKLAVEGKQLAKAEATLAQYKLAFAQKVKALWDEAKRIDGSDNGEHQAYMRTQLTKIIQSKNPSILSKWITIGEYASALTPFKNSLPPQRESLYELAVTAKADGKEHVRRWVKQGALTSETTFREVRSLRAALNKKAIATKPHVTVTLTFNDDYDAVAQVLLALIQSDDVLGVKSDSRLRMKIMNELGDARFSAIEHKFHTSMRKRTMRTTVFGSEVVTRQFKGRTTDRNALLQKYVVQKAVPFVRAIIKKELSRWKSQWGMSSKSDKELKRKLQWGEEYELRHVQTLDDLNRLPETIDFLGQHLGKTWQATLDEWIMEAAMKYEKRIERESNKTLADEGSVSDAADEEMECDQRRNPFQGIRRRDFSKLKV